MEHIPVGKTEKRSRSKYIPFMNSDPDKIVVSMVEFKGRLYVATQKGVYVLNEDVLERVKISDKKADGSA